MKYSEKHRYLGYGKVGYLNICKKDIHLSFLAISYERLEKLEG